MYSWEYCPFYNAKNLHFEGYFDLMVIEFKGKSLNIPVPLIKPEKGMEFFHNAKKRERGNHRRRIKKILPGQEKYLYNKLNKLIPSWNVYADKYLHNKCNTCSFYNSSDNFCAVNPSALKADKCSEKEFKRI